MIPHALSRTLLVLGAVLALSNSHSPPAHAEVLAQLGQRLARAPRVRILTLAGIVEVKGVRVTSEGFTYSDIIASTRPDTLPGSGTLTWDAILGVDAQVNRAAHVAAGTGALLGLVGLIGGIVTDVSGIAHGTWALPGAAIGVVGGGILGATIGSTMHTWVRVYPSSSSPNGATPQRMATDLDTTDSAQVRLIAIVLLA